MTSYYFDTSALIKHYHPEPGAARVDALLAQPGARIILSRLTVVEMTAACAKKVRIGLITTNDFKRITRQFRRDFIGRWDVVRLGLAYFKAAERLIRRIGLSQNLRTLDALQLTVALSLNSPATPIEFVCADQALCTIAAAEGLTAINPELP